MNSFRCGRKMATLLGSEIFEKCVPVFDSTGHQIPRMSASCLQTVDCSRLEFLAIASTNNKILRVIPCPFLLVSLRCHDFSLRTWRPHMTKPTFHVPEQTNTSMYMGSEISDFLNAFRFAQEFYHCRTCETHLNNDNEGRQ